MNATNIPRHSVVRHDGKLWMLENQSKPVQLIGPGGKRGKEIGRYENIEVVKYPAQLAMEYLNNQEATV